MICLKAVATLTNAAQCKQLLIEFGEFGARKHQSSSQLCTAFRRRKIKIQVPLHSIESKWIQIRDNPAFEIMFVQWIQKILIL